MTRHERFDVRVAPEVLASVGGERSRVPDTGQARAFASAMERLRREGTRASAVKKLQGLDLWEARIGDQRVFLRPVPHSNLIAVGAILTKKSRRIRMSRLQDVERVVRAWSDRVEADR